MEGSAPSRPFGNQPGQTSRVLRSLSQLACSSIGLHLVIESAQNRSMKATYSLRWLLVCVALAISGRWAQGEDINYSQPLTQVSFDRLVPTSYPTIRPKFDRLRPTTYPLIHPGVPQIHITEGLTQAFARPLLVTSERPEPGFTTIVRRLPLPSPSPSLVQSGAVITHPSRPAPELPPKAKTNQKQPRNQKPSSPSDSLTRLG